MWIPTGCGERNERGAPFPWIAEVASFVARRATSKDGWPDASLHPGERFCSDDRLLLIVRPQEVGLPVRGFAKGWIVKFEGIAA